MRKLAAGECDATLLALAGLQRLQEADAIASILSPEEMLPAVAQGAIGIETRAGDERCRAWLAPLHHPETAVRITAERALLAALDGSCRTPIAALAELAESRVTLRALILTPDGKEAHERQDSAAVADAARLGTECGTALRKVAGPRFFLERR
jgi:hydroxymethylbilane synthase